MSTTTSIQSVLERQLLLQFGERLKAHRKAQAVTALDMSAKLGVSRPTLRAMESGDPSVSLGSYIRYMSQLGLVSDLAFLAGDAIKPVPKGFAGHASSAHRPVVKIAVKADPGLHKAQDVQSLVLHQEAIRRLIEQPVLLQQAIARLEEQIEKSKTVPNRALPLLKKWKNLLVHQNWRQVLAHTQAGNQLRQASPITTLLPQEVRLQLLEDVRRLRDGIEFETEDGM